MQITIASLKYIVQNSYVQHVMKCSCSSGSSYIEKSEGKKKGRPRVEVQELRIIPVSKAINISFGQ